MLKPLTRMIKMSKCLHISKTLRNNSFKILKYFENSYDLIFISVLEKEYEEGKD